MNNPIDRIVMTSLEELADTMPNLAQAVVRHRHFITTVVDDFNNRIVLVDFTKKIPDDPETYYALSRHLYTQMTSYDYYK